MDLEQSSAAYHICSITSCLLLSLEDKLFRAVTCNYCCHAGEVTVIYGHVNCSYLLNHGQKMDRAYSTAPTAAQKLT